MDSREKLLKRIASYDFAIVELNLFLDSHPNDKTAKLKINEYINKSNKLRHEFEIKYGPLVATSKGTNQWTWISNPWPWDNVEEVEE